MRNTIKNFNSHIYLWYEYKALIKIKSESFLRDKLHKQKKRKAKTILGENLKEFYFRGKRLQIKDCEHVQFMLEILVKNNRLDLLTDEFFEMEK